jgi:asparagine synthetase B (glutamine-hydrolysing)
MPGILGVFGINTDSINKSSLIETINLCGTDETQTLLTDNGFMAISSLKDIPLKGALYYEDKNFISSFSGDLVDYDSIPWEGIINECKSSSFERFSELRGRFAIAVYDKKSMRLYLISDCTSQFPLYYSLTNEYFAFSTANPTFTRLPHKPIFNTNWLYEYIFFNYPIGQTTFLKEVQKMPPSSVLRYDLYTADLKVVQYSKFFEKSKRLLNGQKALDKCTEVFQDRVPKYFRGDQSILSAITGGFDSRTLLSFAPAQVDLETYTYGVPGCWDLQEVSDFAQKLEFPHKYIFFDDKFTDLLPRLIYDTVRLSGGLQGILRSTLSYVYKTLSENGQSVPISINGISGGQLFRGDSHVPSLISFGMERLLSTGDVHIDHDFYSAVFGERFGEFEKHLMDTAERISTDYGDFSRPEAHLSFFVYEVGPKHFGGEAAIADNYTIFRVPYWDKDIIQLAYEIEYSTLEFSHFSTKKDEYRENVMQAYLISQNPGYKNIPIKGLPVTVFASDNRLLYQLNRAIRRGPGWFRRRFFFTSLAVEDWLNWFKYVLNSEFDKLLNDDSIITNYIDAKFIFEMKELCSARPSISSIHWLGKLVTLEILLHLIENEWNM